MNPLPNQLTASDLSAYLDGRELRPPARSPLREAYQEAAAVLAAIRDPKTLRSTEGSMGEAETVLESDLVTTPASRSLGGMRMLKYDVRRAALKRLGTREGILRALDANPQERLGPVQDRFEQLVRGEVPALDKQSAEELDETLQAVLWLDDLKLPGVPQANEVRIALARSTFVRPFERLAGEHFEGRIAELDRLRRFVGVLEPESRSQKLAEGLSRLLRLTPKPALNLFGTGGMGKSALVMRFFLEHLRLPDDRRVPFAYLDFDSPFLNIRNLATVEAEIFRQLALQYPGVVRPATPPTAKGVVDALANLLGQLSQQATQPFLLVLDTFEEVQFGGESDAVPLWDMLNDLQSRWPFLRVLISGRAPVTSFKLAGSPPEPMELTGLDTAAAEAILRRAGVASPDLAKSLVKQVGSVPLSLYLAASVVKREGASSKGVKDLETSTYLFFSVSDEVIQGQLYDRILGHIHNPEVTKLAHPGLVLRKITSDLILKVLKGPCALTVATPLEASVLYNELARETALVSEDADGALSHRPDLRRTMLKLLVEREPQKAEEIHRGAAGYYAGREEMGAAAEELYHRLMLGERLQDREQDLRRQDVRMSLSRSLPELPIAAQIFLSSFGYEVAPEIISQATTKEHEEFLAAKIVELLPHGTSGAAAAADLLKDVSYRGSNSALYLEEARIRFVQGRFDEVFKLLDEGLRYAFEAADHIRILDLLCLKTWALEENGRFDDLAKALPHLASYSDRTNRPLCRIQAIAQAIRLTRRTSPNADVHSESSQLADQLSRLEARDYPLVAPLLRDVFGSVVVDPQCVVTTSQRLMQVRGLPSLTTFLTAAFPDWWRSRSPQTTTSPSEILGLATSLNAIFQTWPNRLPYIQRGSL